MKLEEYIKGETLWIVPGAEKDFLFRYFRNLKQFYAIKVMTLEEFLAHYAFSYDEKTIAYCIEKYDYGYDNLKEYLDILPFLTKSRYHAPKLNELLLLKQELEAQGLLVRDPYFDYYLKQVRILIYGYTELAPFYQEIFCSLSNCKIISNEVSYDRQLEVVSFSSIDDEIGFVFSEIKKLLDCGVVMEAIHLVHVTDEYRNSMKRMSKWFQIPVVFQDETTLWDIPVGKKIVDWLRQGYSFSDVFAWLKEEKYEIKKAILTVFERYWFLDSNYVKRAYLIQEEFRRTKIYSTNLVRGISCESLSYMLENQYYFLVGFNQEHIPTIDKGESVLHDDIRLELGLWDSNQINQMEKQRVKNILYQAKRLTITYKDRTPFNRYNPSLLIEEEKMKVKTVPISFFVSHRYNQMKLASFLDQLRRYSVKHPDLEKLYFKYPISYMTYRNQFTGISKAAYYEYLDHKLLLSFSSLENFYKCGFRYYLSNILKVDPFESTFYTKIGNVFHEVLRICFEDTFDFEQSFEQEVQKYEFSHGEMVLLEKLKEELRFDIKTIHKQMNLSHLEDAYYEEKIYYDLGCFDSLKVTLMGIIDKMMYQKTSQHTLVSIIDYKTGTLPIAFHNMIHGLGMQLPIYYYLVKRCSKLEHPKVVGMYLQKIINKEIPRDPHKDYWQEKEDHLKLVGYSTSQEEYLKEFDCSYQDSHLIKGMKVGSNGFYKYSKVLSEQAFEQMEKLVEKKLLQAARQISLADFSINPKRIGKENVGCRFCRYQDICFCQEEDIVDLQEYHDVSFLGGDMDA
ncbi:MAG: PD-(D/E)XK nuclease family protein [bacterium]|nr:PD-(D/E)XK nuclease family protein [bacterium]